MPIWAIVLLTTIAVCSTLCIGLLAYLGHIAGDPKQEWTIQVAAAKEAGVPIDRATLGVRKQDPPNYANSLATLDSALSPYSDAVEPDSEPFFQSGYQLQRRSVSNKALSALIKAELEQDGSVPPRKDQLAPVPSSRLLRTLESSIALCPDPHLATKAIEKIEAMAEKIETSLWSTGGKRSAALFRLAAIRGLCLRAQATSMTVVAPKLLTELSSKPDLKGIYHAEVVCGLEFLDALGNCDLSDAKLPESNPFPSLCNLQPSGASEVGLALKTRFLQEAIKGDDLVKQARSFSDLDRAISDRSKSIAEDRSVGATLFGQYYDLTDLWNGIAARCNALRLISAQSACAMAAQALLKERLKTGAWPKTADALGDLAQDPYDPAHRLQIKREEGFIKLFSVGPSGTGLAAADGDRVEFLFSDR